MARKGVNSVTDLSDTLHLADCHDGFWLYDDTRGMNLAMHAKTSQEALVEALEYYQTRLKQYEKLYSDLSKRVAAFVEQFAEHNTEDRDD